MASIPAVTTSSPSEMLATGRRHLAVRDYSAAVESLAETCELLAKDHGEAADECAEAYYWYGKALLGLSREERGVLGDGMPGNNADEEDEENDGNEDNEDITEDKNEETAESKKEDGETANEEAQPEEASTTKDEEPESSEMEPGTSNGDVHDESMVNLDNEDDIENLQLAWETLDLARSILLRRKESDPSSRALLADVYLALGEVAIESETYDKAVLDMGSCLEIQKELYKSDDRRIAETHYQIGLANSLASNFEDAITHFKNAANILQSRIKTLENPGASEDATVKKYSADPFYSVEGEIKELKELLPEIQEKIQDMMDCKAEAIKSLRETLCPTNGQGPTESNGAGSSKVEVKPVSNISHLIKRKRKPEEETEEPAAKKVVT